MRHQLAAVLAILAAPSVAGAAIFHVNSPVDLHDAQIDGTCAIAGPGWCTLRAAVEEAQAQSEHDLIYLGPGEYFLGLGELPVLQPGTGYTWIEGIGPYDTVIRGTGTGEHFIQSFGDLFLLDLQIADFDFPTIALGGAITNHGWLYVERCVFSGNSVVGYGGSIFSDETLQIRETAFAFGTATHAGGEIVSAGSFSCIECIFEAAAAPLGGAVWVIDETTAIESSMFSGNSSDFGGALAVEGDSPATVAVRNSTFVGNTATASGGALAVRGPTASLSVQSSTFTANRADTDLDYVGRGGAIWNCCSNGSSISNSILAGNLGTLQIIDPIPVVLEWPQDCAGTFLSNGYNLVLNNGQGFCQLSIPPIASDPGLGPLRYNGGMTPTMAIGPESVAFNAGDPSGCKDEEQVTLEHDQRGAERHSFGRCDLGAFEYGSLIFSDGFDPWGLLGVWSSHTP
jgi:predicted outer membrane repeat protein